MTKPIGYTPEMLAWLKANQAGISRKELTERFNCHFNMSVGYGSIKNLCARKKWISGLSGQITKGSAPWNKGVKGYMGANATSFKKGQTPKNHRLVGSERITVDGYIEVKTAEPKTWRLKHILVWENLNGKLPDSHVIRLLDGDKTNCEPSNLFCISRGAHATSNKRNKANTDNADLNKAVLLTEQIKHTIKNIDRYRSAI